MLNTPEFRKWHRLETARCMGQQIDLEEVIDRAMQEKNLKIEIKKEGKWVEIE